MTENDSTRWRQGFVEGLSFDGNAHNEDHMELLSVITAFGPAPPQIFIISFDLTSRSLTVDHLIFTDRANESGRRSLKASNAKRAIC